MESGQHRVYRPPHGQGQCRPASKSNHQIRPQVAQSKRRGELRPDRADLDRLIEERIADAQCSRLQREALASAAQWLEFHRRFWSGSFDRLDAHLKRKRKDRRP